MVITYLFLFLAFITNLGEAQNVCADETRCGDHGPAIRFPFRLNTQPDQCGYPGFNLSCTDTNQTMLELPISVKLFVKTIDYKSQVIKLYDPDHNCLPRLLRGLDVSSSPFHQKPEYQYRSTDYAVFNCSPREDNEYFDLISCLSGPTYQVYAKQVHSTIRAPLVSCTKMYTLRSFPEGIIEYGGKILELEWSTPDCRYCEVLRGKRCMKSNSSGSGTQCISRHTKGKVFYLSNSFPWLSTYLVKGHVLLKHFD
jgi:hypothetical protein